MSELVEVTPIDAEYRDFARRGDIMQVKPKTISVNVGSLRIESVPGRGRAVRVFIDDKPLSHVAGITLTINPDSIAEATITLLPTLLPRSEEPKHGE